MENISLEQKPFERVRATVFAIVKVLVFCFAVFFVFGGRLAREEPRTLHMAAKHSTVELHPQPCIFHLKATNKQ